jgi:hypothetical protein
MNKKIFLSFNQVPQSLGRVAWLFVGLIATVLSFFVGGYSLTKAEVPYVSELAFIEKSDNLNFVGSVIPASCESNPPEDHFFGDCQCNINAVSPCLDASCSRTIAWYASPSTFHIWRDSTYLSSESGGSQGIFTVPPGGSVFSVRRDDDVILCSSFVTGYPPPILNFLVNGSSNVTIDSAPVTLQWSVDNTDTCTASGSWSGGKAGSSGSHQEILSPAAADNTYTLTCSGPGGSVSRSVNVVVLPPTVTFSASPTLIGPGMSTTLSWDIIGADSCNRSGGWSGVINPPNGSGSQVVSPSYSPSTTFNLSCTGVGGTTNRSVVVTMPSGSITATPCTIPAETGSCLSTVTWNSANFLGNRSVKQGTVQFSTDISGSVSRAVNPDNRTFSLEDTGSAFIQTSLSLPVCQVGSIWVTDAQLCITLPVLSLDATRFVRKGSSADITISVLANYSATCTIQDGSATGYTFVHTPSPAPQSYTYTSQPLESDQIINLTCTHNLYPIVTQSEQARVSVTPGFEER